MKHLLIRNLIAIFSLFVVSVSFGQNTNTFSQKFKISEKTTHKIKKDQEYTFGYLEVLENRDNPNGNTIKLPVYISKSPTLMLEKLQSELRHQHFLL